jgi:Cu/Ag efflux pump CusA
LSPQIISEVYELTRSIHKQVRELKKSNAVNGEREEALETIRQQMERAMIAKLGARAADTYRRNFNNWDEIPDQK